MDEPPKVLEQQRRAGPLDPYQLLRFVIVGGVNVSIDLGVFLILIRLHPTGHAWWLGGLYSVLGWIAGSLVGWRLHSHFTFRARLHLLGFYAVTGTTLVLQYSLSAIATSIWGNSGALGGKLLAIAVAGSFNYLGYQWLASRSVSE